MANKAGEVERKLYYYDIAVFTVSEDGTSKLLKNQAGMLKRAFEYIKSKNAEVEACSTEAGQKEILKGITIPALNGDVIYVIVDEIKDVIKFRIVLSRADAFPFIEKNGILSNITSEVKGDFNVAEVTHCIIFPGDGIMGAEYNFNGARPSAIARYIPLVYENIISVSCHGKMRSDAFNRIIKEKEYSLFELGVKNTEKMKVILRDEMGLIGSCLCKIDDVDTYEICIKRRVTKKKKGFTPPTTIEELKTFVQNNREDIKHFKVSQGIYTDSIDLLKDKLVCSRTFAMTNNKVIDSTQVYSAIEEFFVSEVKDSK